MIDLPPELSDLVLPQYRPAFRLDKEPELPWHNETSFNSWVENPIWKRKAFTADKEHMNSILMSKPIGSLLSLAYLKSVRNHVHRNGLSYLGSYTGPHRTAKSVTASLCAHFWDPSFWPNFEQRVIQSPYQFATTMKNIIDDEIIGAAVVVDEAGTTFSSGDWYEKWMKTIQKFLQVCGMLKPLILFVAPNREFIVSGMRKLIIAEHHMKKFDPRFSRMSAYHVKYNFMKKGDPYFFRRPIIRIAGQTITLKHINIFMPPAFFIERYRNLTEPNKRDRMSAWADEVHKIISGQEDQGEPDYDRVIEEVWEMKEIFLGRLNREGIPTVDQTALEIHFKLKPKHSKYVKERIERRLREDFAEKQEATNQAAAKREQQDRQENESRLKGLKTQLADEFAPPKTEERKEQKEKINKELEDALSSLDE